MTTLPLATHRLRATPRGWAIDRATESGGWARPTYHGRLGAALRVLLDEMIAAGAEEREVEDVRDLARVVERAELTVARAALLVGSNHVNGGRR